MSKAFARCCDGSAKSSARAVADGDRKSGGDGDPEGSRGVKHEIALKSMPLIELCLSFPLGSGCTYGAKFMPRRRVWKRVRSVLGR